MLHAVTWIIKHVSFTQGPRIFLGQRFCGLCFAICIPSMLSPSALCIQGCPKVSIGWTCHYARGELTQPSRHFFGQTCIQYLRDLPGLSLSFSPYLGQIYMDCKSQYCMFGNTVYEVSIFTEICTAAHFGLARNQSKTVRKLVRSFFQAALGEFQFLNN